ncbi:MAG: hypothetical protein J7J22_04570 [Candidatus Verstraetearchaeota archaeon]|nr:hypothetical protein [Candidatus Verstraetearchaeota archaeon]
MEKPFVSNVTVVEQGYTILYLHLSPLKVRERLEPLEAKANLLSNVPPAAADLAVVVHA